MAAVAVLAAGVVVEEGEAVGEVALVAGVGVVGVDEGAGEVGELHSGSA